MNINVQYRNLLREILQDGYEYTDTKRDVKCKQIDSKTLEMDLTEGFPAINLKKLYWKGIVAELLWFLRGDTNIKYLVDNGVHIWDKDAYNWYKTNKGLLPYDQFVESIGKRCGVSGNILGDLGRVYGSQWRSWRSGKYEEAYGEEKCNYTDQISNLIKNLKESPMSRRHIVTAWNPAELDDMALPPCHWSFEVIVRPLESYFQRKLQLQVNSDFNYTYEELKSIPKYSFTLKWHQRSVDTYLGLPFNIASYALLTHIIGKLTNMVPMKLVGDLSNVHLYENSWEASRELLKRDPLKYNLSELKTANKISNNAGSISDKYTIYEFLNGLCIEDFKLKNYKSYSSLKVKMLSPKV